jgi:hypothetical protein
MARAADPKKAALWARRFRRFLDSGLPLARFCAAEQVSESSFYYWRRKLGPQALRRPARAEDRGARAKDRDICAEDRASDYGDRRAVTNHGRVFRPVTVVPAACGVVVRLPGGTRIELEATQLDIIRAVVAETVRADHGLTTRPNVPTERAVFQQRGDARRC